MRLSSIGWLVMLGTGCGGNSASTPDAQSVDAAPDEPDATPEVKITIRAFGTPPALIAYRDGLDGEWQTPAATSTGYEMIVHGPYIVSYTCDDGQDHIATSQIGRTPDDDRDPFVQCGLIVRTLVHVTGQMVQPGTVTVGHTSASSRTPNWSFDVSVEPGTHDVFAVTADRVAIRRDVVITAATALTPALDVVADGTDLVATPFSVSGATAGEDTSLLTSVQTAHAFVLLLDPSLGDPAMQKVVPRSLLAPSEFHKVSISTAALAPSGPPRTTRRVLRRWSDGQSTSFTLPLKLGPIAYTTASGALVATWSTAPDFSLVEGVVSSRVPSTGKRRSIFVQASKHFIDASAPSLRFDVDMPGFQPGWRVDYAKEYVRELTTFTSRGATSDERDESNIAETVNVGQLPI